VKNISNKQVSFLIKPVVFIVCLLPFILLFWQALNDGLGTNPVETLTHETGQWALRFLLIALLVTPLRVSLNKLVD